MSYLVRKIKTYTSRGQSSTLAETGKNSVAKTGSVRTFDNTQQSTTGTKNMGARTSSRTTTGGTGGKATTANTGTSSQVDQQHESFTIQFTVRMKAGLVDPDVTTSPPPLCSPGPGPGI